MTTSLEPNSWVPALIEDTKQITGNLLRIELEMPTNPTAFFRVLISADGE
jgi:hypothetical protein